MGEHGDGVEGNSPTRNSSAPCQKGEQFDFCKSLHWPSSIDGGGPGGAGRAAAGADGVAPVRGKLNQAVAALDSGAGAPVSLLQAVSGCVPAADRMDEVTVQLTRRLDRPVPSTVLW